MITWWDSAMRIAGHVASTHPSPRVLSHGERFDAALDAIIEHAAEHGWPRSDVKDVFRAAANGVDRATYEAVKHLTYRRHWIEPSGFADALAEAVTDRVAVWQICWQFTEGEWLAIWATAEAMKTGGDWRAGARLAGKDPATFATQLSVARRKARRLWVAPGDTPPRHYGKTTGKTDYRTWRSQRRRRAAA